MKKSCLLPLNPKKLIVLLLVLLGTFVYFSTLRISDELKYVYKTDLSVLISDNQGKLLQTELNERGEYMTSSQGSARINELVVGSEDKYFYIHRGVNPVSALRALWYRYFYGGHAGGSTITQQLAKNLLHHENERTVMNKFDELIAALSLEMHTPKKEILAMYLDSAYVGDQVRGIEGGARHYFGKDAAALTDGEILELLALFQSPSFRPGSAGNLQRAKAIGVRVGVHEIEPYRAPPRAVTDTRRSPAMFELASFIDCKISCALSVNKDLTEAIRNIIRDNLSSPKFESVGNAAVAVIRLGKSNEPNHLLALVGSPDPYGETRGNQINMAIESRPIGSTWKPFIYSKAIERGARPYTIINDSEYRYEIGTGYAFYPKNYDGLYRGPVTLHYAISNSLNVPAVRALEFDGITDFTRFLEGPLGFIPKQSLDTYQLSIALGGLEMNPLLLAEYFSVFPRGGILAPLALVGNTPITIPMWAPREANIEQGGIRRIFNATTTEIMNRMLSDRLMGVEQFGLESNLNLPFEGYAVKTGTTYDYHDSWTVGYTKDIVVVAWIGNSNNKAMDLLSGARGAGKIWHDTMSLLYARGDIRAEPFDSGNLVDVDTPEGLSFGLAGDDIAVARTIVQTAQTSHKGIVLEPHDGDVLLYEKGMSVPLRAEVPLVWVDGGKTIAQGASEHWRPAGAGEYVISARTRDGTIVDTLHIHINK